jgi:tetratricopeptide (TPR) repeat protein
MSSAKSSTGRRKWIFRIVALTVIPAVVLVGAELTLRVLGAGYPTGIVVESSSPGGTICRDNIKFSWRFFGSAIFRTGMPLSFKAEKTPGTYRVFVLGASAALGVPDYSFGFSRILDVMLHQRYPGADFEIINLAITALNSHAVLEIARDAAEYQPDLYVVYLGNNEVIGPYGVGSVFGKFSPNLTVIRSGIALKSSRVGQMVDGTVGKLTSRDAAPLTWQGLGMFLENKVSADDESLAHVYNHFSKNLEDIIEVGLDAGAAVIVSTVATNLKDCPPFASRNRQDLGEADLAKWTDLYRSGVELEAKGRYREALERYSRAFEVDDRFAELHFRMALCHWRSGEHDRARELFLSARDLDTLRFRADSRINETVRSVTNSFAGRGAWLVDGAAVLEEGSPHRLPGGNIFYEHVHLRFEGNYLLARSIFERVEEILPSNIAAHRNSDGAMTPEECTEQLALTGWDRHRIAKQVNDLFILKPPSTKQPYFELRAREMAREIAALEGFTRPAGIEDALKRYREAIAQRPSDWQLHAKFGKFLRLAMGDHNGAAEQWRIVVEQSPHRHAYSNLGVALGRQGKYDEAIAVFNEGLERYELFDEGHANLATTLLMKHDLEGAAEHLAKAAEINPQSPPSLHVSLGSTLYDLGRMDDAIEALRRGVLIYPGSADLHFSLGVLLAENGQRAEGIEELREALRLKPDHPMARRALAGLGVR